MIGAIRRMGLLDGAEPAQGGRKLREKRPYQPSSAEDRMLRLEDLCSRLKWWLEDVVEREEHGGEGGRRPDVVTPTQTEERKKERKEDDENPTVPLASLSHR